MGIEVEHDELDQVGVDGDLESFEDASEGFVAYEAVVDFFEFDGFEQGFFEWLEYLDES